MVKQNCPVLSLSTEELALCFSLINRPDLGKMVLMEVYGKTSDVNFDERLVSAAHSLMSKNLAEISGEGTVRPLFDEFIFLPLAQFEEVVQVITSTNDVPVITNIHMHPGSRTFTAHRVRQSVVHELWHGKFEDMIHLILEWITVRNPPQDWVMELDRILCSVSLAELADMQSGTLPPNDKLWRDRGIPKQLAQQLGKDISNGGTRGSIVMSHVASSADEFNADQAGPGIIFWEGKKGYWGVEFPEVNDDASGILFGCSTEVLSDRLQKMLRL